MTRHNGKFPRPLPLPANVPIVGQQPFRLDAKIAQAGERVLLEFNAVFIRQADQMPVFPLSPDFARRIAHELERCAALAEQAAAAKAAPSEPEAQS